MSSPEIQLPSDKLSDQRMAVVDWLRLIAALAGVRGDQIVGQPPGNVAMKIYDTLASIVGDTGETIQDLVKQVRELEKESDRHESTARGMEGALNLEKVFTARARVSLARAKSESSSHEKALAEMEFRAYKALNAYWPRMKFRDSEWEKVEEIIRHVAFGTEIRSDVVSENGPDPDID